MPPKTRSGRTRGRPGHPNLLHHSGAPEQSLLFPASVRGPLQTREAPRIRAGEASAFTLIIMAGGSPSCAPSSCWCTQGVLSTCSVSPSCPPMAIAGTLRERDASGRFQDLVWGDHASARTPRYRHISRAVGALGGMMAEFRPLVDISPPERREVITLPPGAEVTGVSRGQRCVGLCGTDPAATGGRGRSHTGGAVISE